MTRSINLLNTLSKEYGVEPIFSVDHALNDEKWEDRHTAAQLGYDLCKEIYIKETGILDKEYDKGIETLRVKNMSIPPQNIGETFNQCIGTNDLSVLASFTTRLKNELNQGILPMALDLSIDEYEKRTPLYQHFGIEMVSHNNEQGMTIIFSGSDNEIMNRVNDAIDHGLTVGNLSADKENQILDGLGKNIIKDSEELVPER